jgi:hypothetical protein
MSTTTGASTHRWSPAVARVLPTVAALLAATVLVGWAIDAPVLRNLGAGRPAMAPLTAVGILCAAIATLVLAPRGWWRWIGYALGLVVLAIGTRASLEHLLRLERGLAEMLAPLPALQSSAPAALALALLGLGLTMFDVRTKRGHRPSEWLALACALVALMAFSAHAYGAARVFFCWPAAAS